MFGAGLEHSLYIARHGLCEPATSITPKFDLRRCDCYCTTEHQPIPLEREDHEHATNRKCHLLCPPHLGNGGRSQSLLRRLTQEFRNFPVENSMTKTNFLSAALLTAALLTTPWLGREN